MEEYLKQLPVDIDKKTFLKCCKEGDWLKLYTDWIGKLQEVKKPVDKWIKSVLPEIGKIQIFYLRDDTQDLVRRVHWPEWDEILEATETMDRMHLLDQITKIFIDRFAISDVPPWVCKVRNLTKLEIRETSLEKKQGILDYYHGAFPSLQIPAALGNLPSLTELYISSYNIAFPYYLDPEFCAHIHLTHLTLKLSELQSPLEELGLFKGVQDAQFSSRQPLSSYQFLASSIYMKKLGLYMRIEHLPEELRNLHQLEELNIRGNNLTDLPEWIATLPRLRSLVIENPPAIDASGALIPDSLTGASPLSHYPPALRTCPVLVHCSLGVPARSLANLPSHARYWAALAFVSQKEVSRPKFAFDLPEVVKKRIEQEFPNTIKLVYTLFYIDVRITNNGRNNEYWTPADHPDLVAWLDVFYAEPYESLFERVRQGAMLTPLERERFVHETTYQYWELLHSTKAHIDPSLLDTLAAKFALPTASGYSIQR